MANGKNTDPKSLEKVEQLLKRIKKQYELLGESSPFGDPSGVKKYVEEVGNVDDAVKRLDAGLEGVQVRVEKMGSTFGDLTGTLKAIVQEIDPKAFNATKGLKSAMGGLVKEANKLKFEEEGINALSKKELENIIEKTKKSQSLAKENAKRLLGSKQNVEYNEKLGRWIDTRTKRMVALNAEEKVAAGIMTDQGGFQDDLIKAAEERIRIEDAYGKKLGFAVKGAAGLDKALQKAGIPSLGIADAVEKTRIEFVAAAKASKDGEKNFSVLGSLAKNLGKNLKEAFSFANLMQMAVVALFKAIKDVDKHTGETAKNLGISYDEALSLRGEASMAAIVYDDILVDSKAIVGAQIALNKHFGSSVKFSQEMAAEFASIQKRTGLSSDAMGLFAQFALKSDKTIKDILKDTHKVVLQQNQQNKLAFNVKDIQEGIAKTSKSLQLTYKFNTKELANSVIEAKKLGVSLGDVEGIASSLLDFESSIQAELQAEMLLGREINLERARSLALEGDMAGVAKEVLANKAIMQAFDTKNVIAQEAAAKALGMNREQLAGMVMEQKELALLQKNLGHGIENMADAQTEYNELRAGGMSIEEASKKIGDESLANQLESASQAEKLEAIITRVQEVFIAMAVPILEGVEGITKMVGGAENLGKILRGLGILWLGIKGAQLIALAISKKQTKEDKKQLALKTGSAAAFAVANPGAALLGMALAAGVATLIASQMEDGIIDPKGGMVVKGPKGSIQLDKNDSIIAGTDLGGGGGQNSNPESERMVKEQLQETKNQNVLLSKLIGNTENIKNLDGAVMYQIQ